MKKMILIISVFLLFSQCKKESVEQEETSSREVPVTMRLSLNECRTYFDDVIDSGEIYWWNPENEFEYFYLAVEYTSLEWENGSSVVKKHGVLEELVFRAIDPTGVADMKGRMPEVYLKENRICRLYYFGNNGNGADGTNVENITDDRGNLIGKIMHFDKQRGDLKKVGGYHLASVDVRVMRNYGEDGVVTGYSLIPVSPLRNMMSLAVLDLRGERTLNGSATMQQSFSLKWSGSDFEEIVHVDSDGFDVSDNVGYKSFISLLPTLETVRLESGKGHYVFDEGIMKNTIYYGGGENLNEARPLPWNKP